MLQKPPLPERLSYSVREARLTLGVSRATFMRLLENGRIKATRLDRKLLVSRESLEGFAAGQPEAQA
jgi:excisionase family DNA binding protein